MTIVSFNRTLSPLAPQDGASKIVPLHPSATAQEVGNLVAHARGLDVCTGWTVLVSGADGDAEFESDAPVLDFIARYETGEYFKRLMRKHVPSTFSFFSISLPLCACVWGGTREPPGSEEQPFFSLQPENAQRGGVKTNEF